MEKLHSKVIFITGASGGFGKAFVQRLVRTGYRIFGTSRHPEKVKIDDLEGYQDSFSLIEMDVNSSLSVKRALNKVLKMTNRLDVVINNAGYALAGSIEDTTIQEVKNIFNTNFFGVHRVCRQIIPIMRKKGSGRIINISSLIGLVGIPFQGFYAATKYAIEGYTEALRLELEPLNIKVSLVEPGDFHTSLTEHRNIARQCNSVSSYWPRFCKVLKGVEKAERKGERPEKLAALIEKIICSPSPRLRYRIGPGAQIIGVKPLIPESLALKLIGQYYG